MVKAERSTLALVVPAICNALWRFAEEVVAIDCRSTSPIARGVIPDMAVAIGLIMIKRLFNRLDEGCTARPEQACACTHRHWVDIDQSRYADLSDSRRRGEDFQSQRARVRGIP
jgi:hypothetical protein